MQLHLTALKTKANSNKKAIIVPTTHYSGPRKRRGSAKFHVIREQKLSTMNIEIKETREIPEDQLLEIYKLNKWSSAEKPELLYKALINSHTLISAWENEKMVGIANAISDGYLVVYYPHMIVHPDYQNRGIGSKMMEAMQGKFKKYHQQLLAADGKAINFYKKCGFERAGKTESMWIYQGKEDQY